MANKAWVRKIWRYGGALFLLALLCPPPASAELSIFDANGPGSTETTPTTQPARRMPTTAPNPRAVPATSRPRPRPRPMVSTTATAPATAPAPLPPVVAVPVPEAEAQTQALKRVKEAFKDDYARKSVADRRLLAKHLLEQALPLTNDPAARFVMIRESRDLAADAGDAAQTLEAIHQLHTFYLLKDPADGPVGALTKLVPNLPSEEAAELTISACFELVTDAVNDDDYLTANRLCGVLQSLAGKTRSSTLSNKIRTTSKDVQTYAEQFVRVKVALETLKTKPDDPAANYLVGKFYCAAKDDWSHGLPLLAKGPDAGLKALAKDDVGNPTDPLKKAEVGEGWADQAEKDTLSKPWMQKRALRWLKEALPQLKGLEAARVKNRIKGILGYSPVDLVSLVDVRRDSLYYAGSWKVENHTLLADHGRNLGLGFADYNSFHLEFPYLPPDEYDYHVEFTRQEGENMFALLLSRGSVQFPFIMAYQGFYYGFDTGNYYQNLSLCWRKAEKRLRPGTRYDVLVKVRRSNLTAIINGEVVMDCKTDYSDLQMYHTSRLHSDYGLGVAFSGNKVTIHTAEVIEVTGEGQTTK